MILFRFEPESKMHLYKFQTFSLTPTQAIGIF